MNKKLTIIKIIFEQVENLIHFEKLNVRTLSNVSRSQIIETYFAANSFETIT